MQKVIKLLCTLYFLSSMPLIGEEPHLMLHFDINETLIASDLAGGKSIDDVLNELMAKKYTACWDSSVQVPISYNDYVKTVLLPGSSNDLRLVALRKTYLYHFVDYLKNESHVLYQTVFQEYEAALKALNASQSCVFKAFYHLIVELDRQGYSYSIILRSFGHEVWNISDEINLCHKPMFIHKGQFYERNLLINDGSMITGASEIYSALRRMRFVAIRDDWGYWMSNGWTASHGKAFYIDGEDENTLSIFFDDNITTDSVDNIIGPVDVKTGDAILIDEFIQSGQAVRVDTLEAILNEKYFLNKVETAIRSFNSQKSMPKQVTK